MKVEIMFHTSSTPKTIRHVYAVFTKGGLLCVQTKDGWLQKYPLVNVFSVVHRHRPHAGTTRK